MYRIFAYVFLVVGLSPAFASADMRDHIRDIVEAVSVGEEREHLPERVYGPQLIATFYDNRDYQLAWENLDQVRAVLAVLGSAGEHGLNPEDYHFSTLAGLRDEWKQRLLKRDRVRARFDVLLSDGVLLYARHIIEGKVDPSKLETSWNYTRRGFSPEETSAKLTGALVTNNIVDVLRDLEPRFPFYRLLQAELAHYRELAASGSFVPVPEDTVLREGMTHANVLLLRESLGRLNYEIAVADDPMQFDAQLEEAAKDFQHKHGIDVDGVVGRGSFAALNMPYEQRVEQLSVNLDRVRWISQDAGSDFVLVNVAGFELFLFRDDTALWETDVMVGTVQHQTPLFHSHMKYLVLNPTWTVPPGIKRRSIFPKLSKDPGYAADHNFKLYNADGEEVDPLTIDYAQYSPGRFPYRVVQQPGPHNALGQVKFIFPNQYAVYLHDTPHRELFSKTSRAFSSGCIRVLDPIYFAELLVQNRPEWDRAAIDKTLEGGKQTVVHLKEPLDVMLMYWTASPDPDRESIQFHPDIYSMDDKAIAALRQAPDWNTN